ncbi:methyltransferase [Gallaecimonas sp. GXIMD4217]|uniref:methyltransferase n=1 Tax=Gallaecimonas sp. GXIMD4217 TaxID=3131927 RepID=UPI00311AC37A
MLENPSQLLLRNLAIFEEGPLLISQAPRDELAATLVSEGLKPLMHHSDYLAYQGSRRHLGDNAQFAPVPAGQARHGVLFIPKAKEELRMQLAALAACVGKGGNLYVIGENKGGIKSAAKLLEPYGQVEKLDSARHCSLFVVTLSEQPAPFVLNDWQHQHEIEVAGESLIICSLPGVFSHGELDQGTRLLLEHLPRVKAQGRILDFGCGAGVIGAYLARKAPQAQVEMLDVSALAIAASHATLAANGLDNAKVQPGSGLGDLHGRFHQIITNPPFHTGVGTDYSATESLLREAPARLVQGGDLVVVANSFLRYEPIMAAGFGKVERLADDRKFRVYCCRGSGR